MICLPVAWVRSLQLVALGFLAACSTPQPPTPAAEATTQLGSARPLGLPKPPSGPVPASPWSQKGCTPGKLTAEQLACVGGAPVTRAQFDAAWAVAPAGSDARAVLQSLIDEELLAQAAAARQGWTPQQVGDAERRSLAGVLLDRAMAQITPAKIADADIQKAYRFPQIITRYDHADAWFVIDGQMLCCTGNAKQCAQRDEVRSCIAQSEAAARAVYAKLAADPPKSALEATARLKVLSASYPDLGVAEVHFYYDKSKPYEQQKGYDLMVKEFAEAVIEMQPGEFHQPIRSDFGWHISYLEKMEPASHRPWNDPQVRAEIAENALIPIREREAQRFAFELLRKYGVQYFYDRLDPEVQAATGAAEP